jgi:hypothetical protein
MNHTVQIIETKQLSDGEFAILSQCCDDPTTKSYGTLSAATCSDPAKLQSFIDFHHNRIANLHDLAIQGRAAVAGLIGSSFAVTVPAPAPASPDPSTPSDPTPDPSSTSPGA